MCFIPIHLERSRLTLHFFSFILYPYSDHMQMLHLLHRRAWIYLWVSKKWSKRTNWFLSSFIWNRMRIWCGNHLIPTTRRVVYWDGRLGNLTVCGLQVWDMSVSLNVAFLFCTRITKTRHLQGRQEEGINVDSPLCNLTTLLPKVHWNQKRRISSRQLFLFCLSVHHWQTARIYKYLKEFPNYNWLWLGRNFSS